MMIKKAIVFDWGGVLVKYPTQKIITIVANRINVDKNEFSNVAQRFQEQFQRGLVSEKEYWSQICETLNVEHPSKSIWKEIFSQCYIENKEVFNLARKLKKRGIFNWTTFKHRNTSNGVLY